MIYMHHYTHVKYLFSSNKNLKLSLILRQIIHLYIIQLDISIVASGYNSVDSLSEVFQGLLLL